MAINNPRMLTLPITNANQNYQISALMTAVDSSLVRPFLACRRIVIQADVSAGGTKFKLGNSDLSETNRGTEFYATQAVLYEHESDTIDLTTLYVRADAAGKSINVSIQWA